MAFIAIDIGNTDTKVALIDREIKAVLRLNTKKELDLDSCISLVKERFGISNFDGGIISSVVPEKTGFYYNLISSLSTTQPFVLDHNTYTGLKIRLRNPETLGSDRIANAVGAYSITCGKTVVVDFGTATTTTAVNDKGEIIYGTIMPGVDMMFQVLHEKTSKLPLLKIYDQIEGIGRDTKSSIISGIVYGTAGAVERILEQMGKELGRFSTVITGGVALSMKRYLRVDCLFVEDLTLRGLKIIFERNYYESAKT